MRDGVRTEDYFEKWERGIPVKWGGRRRNCRDGGLSGAPRRNRLLLSYPEENSFDAEQEAQFLQEKTESAKEIEIIALADGRVVGTAGIEALGAKYKVRHRAEIGISVLKEYWGLGLGRALMEACIQCAREAGYAQLELDVVADNARALELYQKLGFVEYGRNPRGFRSRGTGFQELVLMRLEL